MYELAYLPLIPSAVKRRARPFSAGALLAFSLLYPFTNVERYVLIALSGVIFLLGWPFEKQPLKFRERFLNAVISGTSLAIALGLYNAGHFTALLGLAVPLLLFRNRVLASFGLLPASALYLAGYYKVSADFKLALFALVYIYSLNNLRKLMR